MSTRSRIAVRNADGTFTSSYVHYDGYPEGVGSVLAEHYTDPAKVAALLALGDLSILAEEVGEQHPFEDHSRPDWCRAYGRDRGETGTAAVHSADLETLVEVAADCWAQWLYLWNGGGWSATPVERGAAVGLKSVDHWLQRAGA